MSKDRATITKKERKKEGTSVLQAHSKSLACEHFISNSKR